jgi:hypothetical protein
MGVHTRLHHALALPHRPSTASRHPSAPGHPGICPPCKYRHWSTPWHPRHPRIPTSREWKSQASASTHPNIHSINAISSPAHASRGSTSRHPPSTPSLLRVHLLRDWGQDPPHNPRNRRKSICKCQANRWPEDQPCQRLGFRRHMLSTHSQNS